MEQTHPIHVTNTVEQIIADLRKTGFGGVRFFNLSTWHNTLEDFLEDGRTKEEWEQALRDYVTLQIEPDFPDFSSDDDCPYVEPREFHDHLWWRDFRKMLSDRLGPDVNVGEYRPCGEMEIGRQTETAGA